MSYFKGQNILEKEPRFRPNTSVIKVIVDNLLRNEKNLAVIEADTGKSETFEGLLQLSMSLAAGLQNQGISAGDLVVLCIKKSIITYSLLLGIIYTGATVVLIPHPWQAKVYELLKDQYHLLKGIFCDTESYPSIIMGGNSMNLSPHLVYTVDGENPTLASFFQSPKTLKFYDVSDNKRHIPVILFTSGSTGEPKGVMITDIALQLSGMYSRSFQTCKRVFHRVMLGGISSLHTFMSSLLNNFCYVVSNSENLDDHLKAIEMYQVDRWPNNTVLLHKYLEESSIEQYDLSSVTWISLGSNPVQPTVMRTFRNKVNPDANFLIRYGSTETGLISLWERVTPNCTIDNGSCGTAAPGVQIKIVDERGEIVPIGCLGHIRVKTIGMMAGYWRIPDLTNDVFDENGFYKTGDVGYFNKNGYLYHQGRATHLINFRGFKFSTVPLEEILLAHPAIKDALLVGKPHSKDNHHMTAFIVKDQRFQLLEDEVEVFFNEQVNDRMKLRGGVIFLEKLPINFAHKHLKALCLNYFS